MESRLKHAFNNWMKVLLPKSTEVDVILRLDKFVTLRDYFTNDQVGPIFVEKGMAKEFMDALHETTDLDTLVCLLFTISDILDIDNSEVVCHWFEDHGLVEYLIRMLRRSDVGGNGAGIGGNTGQTVFSNQAVVATGAGSGSRDTSRLKAASICALSSMTSFSFYKVAETIDRREIDLLNNILQLKSMMSLHSRCIIFINNLYVSDVFVDLISRQVIPSVMTLLMYNVTNHIKLIKKRIQDNLARTQHQHREMQAEQQKRQQKPSTQILTQENQSSAPNIIQTQAQTQPESASVSKEGISSEEDSSEPSSDPNQALSGSTSTHQAQVFISGSPSTTQTTQEGDKAGKGTAISNSNSSPPPAAGPAHDQVDKMYNDALYVDFIASACVLLGNLTTSYDNCLVAESYSVIDIMTLLFHNSNDHNTPEVMANVVKCLANLAAIPANHPKLRKSNILAMAIRLLLAPRLRLDLRAHLILLLANMVGSEGANAQIIDRAVIFAIASFLDDITNPEPPESVTAGIKFDTFGYSTYQDPGFKRFGCLLVANLSTDDLAVPLLIDAGVLRVIVAQCYSDQADIQRQAVRAIFRFASYHKGELANELEKYEASKALQHVINSELVRFVIDPENPANSAALQKSAPPSPTSDPALENATDAKEAPNKTRETETNPHLVNEHSESATVKVEVSTTKPTTENAPPPLSSVEILAVSALAAIKTSPHRTLPTSDTLAPNTASSAHTAHNGDDMLTGSGGVESSKSHATSPENALSDTEWRALNAQVAEEKTKGNEHFNAKRWQEAITCYSRGIDLNPKVVILFSNRSAAYTQLGQYQLALDDAEKCIILKRDWVKGHFRRGKALMGLQRYTEAIVSLKEALNCEVGSKEIQEALRAAVLKAREAEATFVDPNFCHLNAAAIVQLLKQIFAQSTPVKVPITLMNSNDGTEVSGANAGKKMEIGVEHVSQLLLQLLELLKAWYEPTTTVTMKRRLMGETEPDDMGLELHDWASRVNVAQLMQSKYMDYILFVLDMAAPGAKALAQQYPDEEHRWYANSDLSCYQFGFFLTTILTRLVLEAHNGYAVGAMKRIIQLNSDRLIRLSIGTPLSQAAMQVSGEGMWGLPKMPWLRQLFIANAGLRCIAMDSYECGSFDPKCIALLHSVTSQEWLSLPQDQIDSVIEWTVLPAFHDGPVGECLDQVVELFGTLFALPGTRHNTIHYAQHLPHGEFFNFVMGGILMTNIKLQAPEAGAPPTASPEAKQQSIIWAKEWIARRKSSAQSLASVAPSQPEGS
jgi:tetratricopeptide (TPR) repeat protein